MRHDAVQDEHTRMESNDVIEKKANGTERARLNARGFEQVDGIHYTTACPKLLLCNLTITSQ